MACRYSLRLWQVWVKAPLLQGADLLVASACLPHVNREVYERLSAGRVPLLACPEAESPAYYGKLASVVRSSRPRSVGVGTIDGSPHCFALHASVNEAEYVLGEKLERKHYVLVNATELREVSPDAVRVARYLSLVDELIRANPWVLERLKGLSLEYRRALELR